jgi:hypothetical protein
MSLRKSPQRTPASLAANRTNALKSTGPRGADGKQRSSWNATRHARRMCPGAHCVPFAHREAEDFQAFYFCLRDAILPAPIVAAERALLRAAVKAWRVKWLYDGWARRRTAEDWRFLEAGAAAPPRLWRLRIKRPGRSEPDWKVTISVWLRWAKRPNASRPPMPESGARHYRPGMHAMLLVHSTGPCRPSEALERQRTKPESNRKQGGSGNMPARGGHQSASARAIVTKASAAGEPKPRSARTKPECNRKESGSENISVCGGARTASARANEPGAQAAGEVTAGSQRTKPESSRKKGAYQNISEAIGWLADGFRWLLNGHSSKPAIGSAQTQGGLGGPTGRASPGGGAVSLRLPGSPLRLKSG